MSGLFCPSASLGCSWWSPHKDGGKVGREGNREEEGGKKRTQSLSVGRRLGDKGKREENLPLPLSVIIPLAY